MSFCINPKCDSPANEDADMSCTSCGTDLLLAGQYRVRELLSSGTGFGLIYQVVCQNSQKILKVLDLEVLKKKGPKALEHFKREAEVLKRLNHPGIPRGEEYFEVSIPGSKEILYCFVMEKIQGLDLAAWLEKYNNKPISENLALKWLKQITEIIHVLHQEDLFHRDIKPSNIMLNSNGGLVLIDFGTAKKTGPTYIEQQRKGEGTIVYSPGYAPLEQEIGKATPQSDFFAIGRTFVHLLTGKKPNDIGDNYRNSNTDESWDWRPEAPHITPALADFIDYLMEANPAKRPQNSQFLIDQVKKLDFKLTPQRTVYAKGKSSLNISERVYQFNIQQERTCGNVSTWHSSIVTSIVTTVDGAMIISASADGLLKSWDVESGEQLEEINLGIGAIACLTISPDGSTLIAASNTNTVLSILKVKKSEYLWAIQAMRTCPSEGYGCITDLIYSPDGQSVLVGTQNKTVLTYNPKINQFTGQIYTNHKSEVASLDINPDGSYFISAGTDRIIRVWPNSRFFQHEKAVLVAKLSPKNGFLISGTTDGEIKVWNIRSGDLVHTLKQDAGTSINTLLVSNDGNFLVSGSGNNDSGTITIWDLNIGQEIQTFNDHMHTVSALAITPDGKRLISGSHDRSIKIWEVVSGSPDMLETSEATHDR
jgi:serine/threonine protein kinase